MGEIITSNFFLVRHISKITLILKKIIFYTLLGGSKSYLSVLHNSKKIYEIKIYIRSSLTIKVPESSLIGLLQQFWLCIYRRKYLFPPQSFPWFVSIVVILINLDNCFKYRSLFPWVCIKIKTSKSHNENFKFLLTNLLWKILRMIVSL